MTWNDTFLPVIGQLYSIQTVGLTSNEREWVPTPFPGHWGDYIDKTIPPESENNAVNPPEMVWVGREGLTWLMSMTCWYDATVEGIHTLDALAANTEFSNIDADAIAFTVVTGSVEIMSGEGAQGGGGGASGPELVVEPLGGGAAASQTTGPLDSGFLKYDVRGDGKVNILDMIAVRNLLGADWTSGPCPGRRELGSDLNGDSKINILDLIAIRNKINTAFPIFISRIEFTMLDSSGAPTGEEFDPIDLVDPVNGSWQDYATDQCDLKYRFAGLTDGKTLEIKTILGVPNYEAEPDPIPAVPEYLEVRWVELDETTGARVTTGRPDFEIDNWRTSTPVEDFANNGDGTFTVTQRISGSTGGGADKLSLQTFRFDPLATETPPALLPDGPTIWIEMPDVEVEGIDNTGLPAGHNSAVQVTFPQAAGDWSVYDPVNGTAAFAYRYSETDDWTDLLTQMVPRLDENTGNTVQLSTDLDSQSLGNMVIAWDTHSGGIYLDGYGNTVCQPSNRWNIVGFYFDGTAYEDFLDYGIFLSLDGLPVLVELHVIRSDWLSGGAGSANSPFFTTTIGGSYDFTDPASRQAFLDLVDNGFYIDGVAPGIEDPWEVWLLPGVGDFARMYPKVTVLDFEITEIKGLYGSDGIYYPGYTSEDDEGRIYSNRIYNPDDATAVLWMKDTQYVDITVEILQPPGVVLPPGSVIFWEFEDPDDPSNEDPDVHADAKPLLDPNDYDAEGAYLGPTGDDNTGGLPVWGSVPGHPPVDGSVTPVIDRKSIVRFHVTDDGGDNFIVKATLLAIGQVLHGDKTGIMTVWKRMDVEYRKMDGQRTLPVDDVQEHFNLAFVEFVMHDEGDATSHQFVEPNPGATPYCAKWTGAGSVGQFRHRGDGGWVFLCAALNFWFRWDFNPEEPSHQGTATVLNALELEDTNATFIVNDLVNLAVTINPGGGNETWFLIESNKENTITIKERKRTNPYNVLIDSLNLTHEGLGFGMNVTYEVGEPGMRGITPWSGTPPNHFPGGNVLVFLDTMERLIASWPEPRPPIDSITITTMIHELTHTFKLYHNCGNRDISMEKGCVVNWSDGIVFNPFARLPVSNDHCAEHIMAVRAADGFGGE